MRAHAATRRSVAHHQIVEPREGQERETAQQRIPARIHEIDTLDEQRPVAGGSDSREDRANGPCASVHRFPSRTTTRDSTSSRRGEREQIALAKRPAKPGRPRAPAAVACASAAGGRSLLRRPPSGSLATMDRRRATEATIDRL
jgi:hypothetical protein